MNAIVEMMDSASLPDIKKQREKIIDLENAILAAGEDAVDMPPTHLVHGGMYARAVTVPEGTVLTGHIYKYDHIEIMTSGLLAVTTDDGASRVLEGFNIMPALTGKKRAAYALKETTWLTVHAVGDTGSKTPDEIQDFITASSFDDLEDFYAEISRADYACFLAERGWSETDVRAVSENKGDYQTTPDLSELGLKLQKSKIEGTGLFAQKAISKGAEIMPARIDGNRTEAGRYINHAVRPNAHFVLKDGDMFCVAARAISAGDEITVSYREVMNYREGKKDLCQE